MNRPYIFCHMMTSIDGKIMGLYMDTTEGEIAGDVFYNLAFGKESYYKHQGWVCGRITTDDNFTFYKIPALDENAPTVPEGDFVAKPHASMYYVSVDPSGKLAWENSEMTYIDTTAHIIEVLTEKTSNVYKAFLRKLNISYIITVSALMASGILDSSLRGHIQRAKENGITKEEMIEVLTQLAFYAGWPKAWAAFYMAKEIYSA